MGRHLRFSGLGLICKEERCTVAHGGCWESEVKAVAHLVDQRRSNSCAILQKGPKAPTSTELQGSDIGRA